MSSEEDKIVINGLNVNQNVTKVLSEVCVNLQKQYDISPKLINKIINSLNLLEKCIKANEDQSAILEQLFQKTDELAEQETNIADLNSSWESEGCGYVVKSYQNGFKKYCNVHKYNHNPDNLDKEVKEHEFLFKSRKQVVEEKTFSTKLHYYQDYLHNLLNIFQDIIRKQIKEDYTIIRVRLEDIFQLNDWLKSREDCFKTRFMINLVTMDTSKAEYSNYIDIYIPKDKLEKSLSHFGKINYFIQ